MIIYVNETNSIKISKNICYKGGKNISDRWTIRNGTNLNYYKHLFNLYSMVRLKIGTLISVFSCK